jgi:hypothetical protein
MCGKFVPVARRVSPYGLLLDEVKVPVPGAQRGGSSENDARRLHVRSAGKTLERFSNSDGNSIEKEALFGVDDEAVSSTKEDAADLRTLSLSRGCCVQVGRKRKVVVLYRAIGEADEPAVVGREGDVLYRPSRACGSEDIGSVGEH